MRTLKPGHLEVEGLIAIFSILCSKRFHPNSSRKLGQDQKRLESLPSQARRFLKRFSRFNHFAIGRGPNLVHYK